jgi:glycosyltransferase involved in cell wall biosynthesis
MTKVVIVSGIQIIDNPRVVKEANALSKAGFDVEVIGAVYDIDSSKRVNKLLHKAQWRHIPVIDLSDGQRITRMRYFLARFQRKISFLKKKWLGIESPNQLGYFTKRLYRIAKSRKADLYIMHLEQALWVGRKLLENSCNVAIDVEDWYSEDGLSADRALRPMGLMKECEQYLLQNAAYCTTTSSALSKALSEAYQCSPPTVIYNSFPLEDRFHVDGQVLDKHDTAIPSIIWFSQTVGPGRGLEQLLLTLQEVDYPFELHIRGTLRKGYKEALVQGLPRVISDNIYFHVQVPQDELLSRLSEHDIGYCGELSDCFSRDLTITNKALEYLRAGLAIIASDTTGHTEVASLVPEGVHIYQQNNISTLDNVLNKLLGEADVLKQAKVASSRGMDTILNWQKSEVKMIELVSRSLVRDVDDL